MPFFKALVAVATMGVAPILAGPKFVLDVAQGRNVGEAAVDLVVGSVPGGALAREVIENKKRKTKRVLIHDASDGRGFLGVTWDVGAIIMTRFSHVIRGTSWAQVAAELEALGGNIEEVQYWGHGGPGYAMIGDDMLDGGTLQSAEWLAIRDMFVGGGVFWLRTCSSFNGDDGRRFAEELSRHFNVKVAGHTKLIHAIHPGLVTLKPGHDATWGNGSGKTCLCTDVYHPAVNKKY